MWAKLILIADDHESVLRDFGRAGTNPDWEVWWRCLEGKKRSQGHRAAPGRAMVLDSVVPRRDGLSAAQAVGKLSTDSADRSEHALSDRKTLHFLRMWPRALFHMKDGKSRSGVKPEINRRRALYRTTCRATSGKNEQHAALILSDGIPVPGPAEFFSASCQPSPRSVPPARRVCAL